MISPRLRGRLSDTKSVLAGVFACSWPARVTSLVIREPVVRQVKQLIREKDEILMGACRDAPTPGSIGAELVLGRHGSPQQLSYLIPILTKDGYCEAFRPGPGFVVRHKDSVTATANSGVSLRTVT